MNKEIYGMYCPDYDITFIMEEVRTEKGGTLEVKGFYFGEPNDEDNKTFYNDTIAELDY